VLTIADVQAASISAAAHVDEEAVRINGFAFDAPGSASARWRTAIIDMAPGVIR
jgi:hypothetical protein